MEKIIFEKSNRVKKNRKRLEEELEVKITYRGKEIIIEGPPENEKIAIQMIEALDFGFPFTEVISMKKEEKIFTKINLKEHTLKKNFSSIRSRIIGKSGKAIKSLSDLSDCKLELKNNEIGIIGNPEDIEKIAEALIQLIQGAKHGHVYTFLEKSKYIPLGDLGLKKKK